MSFRTSYPLFICADVKVISLSPLGRGGEGLND